MFRNKLLDFLNESITGISQICLGYIAVMCLLFQTNIGFGGVDLYSYEYAAISKNSIFMISALLLSAYIFMSSKNKLNKIDEKSLFLSFATIYLIFGTFLIFNSLPTLKDDVLFSFHSARDLNKGIYTSFLPRYFYDTMKPEGYLYHNPHQLGMVTIERILFFISTKMRFFQFINLFIVLVTNYYIWQTVKLLSNNNKVASNASIMISFLFFPQFFFILFVYGILPANLLIILSYYNFIRYSKDNKTKYLVYHIMFIAFAVLLKENSFIALIAFIILHLMKFIDTKKRKWIMAPLIMISVVFISIFSLKQYYQYEIGHKINEGMPKLSYLYMGISPNTAGRVGGWWTGYNIDLVKNAEFDKKKMDEMLYKDLSERAIYLISNPLYTYKFFSQKITSIWTDPMFQSVWSGPLQKSRESLIIHNLFHDLSNVGPNYKVFKTLSHIILFLIYIASFLFVFSGKKVNNVWLFPYLYFLGGFVFHIFWEAKSQYGMTYVLMLIPICSLYISSNNIKDMFKNNVIKKYKKLVKIR